MTTTDTHNHLSSDKVKLIRIAAGIALAVIFGLILYVALCVRQTYQQQTSDQSVTPSIDAIYQALDIKQVNDTLLFSNQLSEPISVSLSECASTFLEPARSKIINRIQPFSQQFQLGPNKQISVAIHFTDDLLTCKNIADHSMCSKKLPFVQCDSLTVSRGDSQSVLRNVNIILSPSST